MENNQGTGILKLIFGGIVGLVAMVLFFSTYFTVGQYERAVVTRFGKIVEIAEPGLHFKIPFVHSTHFYRTDILSLTTAEKLNKGLGVSTYTVDNQEVHVVFVVQYRLRPDKIAFIYENVQDLEARLFQIAEDRLKAEMGKVNTSHVAEKRGIIRDGIKKVMQEAVVTLGVEIADFQLSNIEYDATFKTAVKQAAAARATVETREQERQQAIKVAEKAKIVAEGEANAARETASGKADAIVSVATAEAKAIQMRGEAEAKAIRAQAEALQQNQKLVELRKAERWDGKLPVQMLSNVLPMMQFQSPTDK
jgi:regulator of protease activity HflC (stomatin/prohibitin superfamily)